MKAKDVLAGIGVFFLILIIGGCSQALTIKRLEEKTGQDCTPAGYSYICTDKKEESK